MRAKQFLKNETVLRGDPAMYNDAALATAKGILTRDFNDVSSCDVMVACFLGATKVSIGTCAEFGFAHALRKPVILIMEKDGKNVHSHAFLTEIAGYWVDTFEEAANITKCIVTPGV